MEFETLEVFLGMVVDAFGFFKSEGDIRRCSQLVDKLIYIGECWTVCSHSNSKLFPFRDRKVLSDGMKFGPHQGLVLFLLSVSLENGYLLTWASSD